MTDIKMSDLIAPAFYELYHDIKQETNREYWLKGGRGSTKSTFAAVMIILGMLRDKNANAVCFRRYSNELRDTVYGQVQWVVNKIGAEHLFKMQYAPMQIIYLPTGQRIIFKGADNPHKLKSMNIGKGYVKFLHFEEVDQYSGMQEIRNIIQSVFRGDDTTRISLYTYNPPPSGRSWVNQEVKIPKEGRRVHHSTYLDVPCDWLGDSFLIEAEHLRSVNETAYKHEYLGEEVGTGLEIFNNVIIQELGQYRDQFTNIRPGLDFGYAVDPLAYCLTHYDTSRRRLFIFDEISGINLLNREFFSKLQAKGYERLRTIADSAEPKSIAELKDLGMNIVGAQKGQGSVEFGIKFLQGLEKIYIDPVKCPRATKEFVNYAHEQDRDGEIKSSYPDKDNHVIDCVRYALSEDMAVRRIKSINKRALGL